MGKLFIFMIFLMLVACENIKNTESNKNIVKRINSKNLIIGYWKKKQDSIATERFTLDTLTHLLVSKFFPPMKYEIINDTMISGYDSEKQKAEIMFLDSNSFVLTSFDTLIKPIIIYKDTFYRVQKKQ